MCIVFLAVEQHPHYPLIIAANRDEFFERPSLAANFWQDAPNVWGGRDVQAGGSWLGVNRDGRIAALTNIRDPQNIRKEALSRGHLVQSALCVDDFNVETFTETLRVTKNHYNGYNLVFGHWQQLWVYNNHLDHCQPIEQGVHALSNAFLNSPWPKAHRGVERLRTLCQHAQENGLVDALFDLLTDRTPASDEQLPNTGVGLAWERVLSPIFIATPDYGTRTSTIIMVDNEGQAWLYERQYQPVREEARQITMSFS